MAKVLIFTYYWPPSGGPAVQRWLSLAKLLPEFGVELIVITPDEQYASFSMWDESLNAEIPDDLRVHKTKTFEILSFYKKTVGKGNIPTAGFANESSPSFLQKVARRVRGNCFFPDPRKGWNKYALRQAREILQKEQVDWVITAGPPQSTHLIGLQLKKEFGVRWMCDFHDAWTNVWYYDTLMRTNWAKAKDAKMELNVLRQSDSIMTVGEQIYQDFTQKLGSDQKLRLHSMGYDEELFGDVKPAQQETFTIVYTGTMADNYEPQVLFEGLKELSEEQPSFSYKLKLVGLISDGIKSDIETIGILESTEMLGYRPHKEAIDHLKSGALLLLVSPNSVQSKMIIPGKIYEYFATRIPILNLATADTETYQMIERESAGKTFDRSQKAEIKKYIWSLFQAWKTEPESILNKSEGFKKYARRTEAKGLAEVLAHS